MRQVYLCNSYNGTNKNIIGSTIIIEKSFKANLPVIYQMLVFVNDLSMNEHTLLRSKDIVSDIIGDCSERVIYERASHNYAIINITENIYKRYNEVVKNSKKKYCTRSSSCKTAYENIFYCALCDVDPDIEIKYFFDKHFEMVTLADAMFYNKLYCIVDNLE